MATIAFTINNKPASVDVEPDTPLLWVVREHLKLTGKRLRHLPMSAERVKKEIA